jgi:hypothetical protein
VISRAHKRYFQLAEAQHSAVAGDPFIQAWNLIDWIAQNYPVKVIWFGEKEIRKPAEAFR